MRRATKIAIAASGLLAAAAAGWLGSGHEVADSKVLVNRIWIDKLPSRDTDHFELLVIVTEEPVGLFRRSSSFEGSYALFRYELRDGNKLQLLFPQDKSKHEVKYDARACDVKDFDYCLDLTGAPRGAKKYLSRKEWELEGGDAAEVQHQLDEWVAQNMPPAAE
jgi:hypothetical protein